MDASFYWFLICLGSADLIFVATIVALGISNAKLKQKIENITLAHDRLTESHKNCDRDIELEQKQTWEATEAIVILQADHAAEVQNLQDTIHIEAVLLGKLSSTLALESKRTAEIWNEKCELQRDKDALLVVLRSMTRTRRSH